MGPWCFDFPRGKFYKGRVNVTVGGLPCRRWDNVPLKTLKSARCRFWGFPDRNIHVAENYCRNPDGDIWPWCFTEDPNVPFDFCSVEDLVCNPDEELWDEISNTPKTNIYPTSTTFFPRTDVQDTSTKLFIPGEHPRAVNISGQYSQVGTVDSGTAVPSIRFIWQISVVVVLYRYYLCVTIWQGNQVWTS